MHWVLIAIVVALLIANAGSLGVAQMTMNAIVAIEKMDLGKPPADFDFGRTGQRPDGKWSVVDDTSATTGRAIEQGDTDRTDYRFPLAIYRSFTAKNLEASLRFKAVEGGVDRAGGVAVRVIDADNYYVLRANALEDNVRLYKVTQGRRVQIAGADLKVTANEWHTLTLKLHREHFTVSYDGRELYQASDRSIIKAGKVALWTKADSVTRFDQIQMKVLQQ